MSHSGGQRPGQQRPVSVKSSSDEGAAQATHSVSLARSNEQLSGGHGLVYVVDWWSR